jgi:AGCS family alanine or glycine:cation symporter
VTAKEKAIMDQLISKINQILWGLPMMIFLLGVGLYFTYHMRGVQIRLLYHSLKIMLWGEKYQPLQKSSHDYISTFQAFATGLATRAGIGNIVGVATAIASGGPGAVFWMWLSAWIGMASAFAESSLAQLFKEPRNGLIFRGGPSYYIRKGLGKRWLGTLFALSMIMVGFVFGNIVQVNTISHSIIDSYHVPKHYVGILLVLLLTPILIGGSKRIARVSAILAPLLVFCYLLMASIIIVMNIHLLPKILMDIMSHAFGFNAALGGATGIVIREAMMMGVKRGLFSNEAGMGSAPHAAACSHASHPAAQGLAQMLAVFVDTIVLCTATAFIILISDIPLTGQASQGILLTQRAIELHFGNYASHFVTWSIFLFAFSSILGYYVYTESNLEFLMNQKTHTASNICRLLFIGTAYIGCFLQAGTAWNLADIGAGCSAIINLIALLILSPTVIFLLKDYEEQLNLGIVPMFSRGKIPHLYEKLSSKAWP